MIFRLLTILALVLLNGFFVGAEFALVRSRRTRLEAMTRAVDCLVVMCPLTPATRDLVSKRVIDALRPGSFLVNIARGPVVNQEALIAALREKRIAGAGLDVYWDEPNVPPELMAMDNVVRTFLTMVNLPPEANILNVTVMASAMPFVGRG